jgi:hypothetical protein
MINLFFLYEHYIVHHIIKNNKVNEFILTSLTSFIYIVLNYLKLIINQHFIMYRTKLKNRNYLI